MPGWTNNYSTRFVNSGRASGWYLTSPNVPSVHQVRVSGRRPNDRDLGVTLAPRDRLNARPRVLQLTAEWQGALVILVLDVEERRQPSGVVDERRRLAVTEVRHRASTDNRGRDGQRDHLGAVPGERKDSTDGALALEHR